MVNMAGMAANRPMGMARKEVISAEALGAGWTRASAKAMSKPVRNKKRQYKLESPRPS